MTKLRMSGKEWPQLIASVKLFQLVQSAVLNRYSKNHIWPRGPMDKASAYGAGDCRFESCRGHLLLQDYLQWLRRYDNLSAFVLHQVDVDLLIAE